MKRNRYFLVGFVFLVSVGFSALTDHFKTIDSHSNRHSIRKIDFIYMINLDQRPEKWEESLAKLMPYGIEPYRFSAVNGWELSLEDINDVGLKFKKGMKAGGLGNCYYRDATGAIYHTHEEINKEGQVYFTYGMARGTIGIILSHLSILQDAYNQNYETIWIMEDDIEIVQDPRILSDLIEELDRTVGKKYWDVLFTDRDTRTANGEYVQCGSAAPRPDLIHLDPSRFKLKMDLGKFRKIGARYGAYSMILRRSGIKKILDFYKKHPIFLPYDLDYYLAENIALYTVNEDIVRHRLDALSDNGAPYYKIK